MTLGMKRSLLNMPYTILEPHFTMNSNSRCVCSYEIPSNPVSFSRKKTTAFAIPKAAGIITIPAVTVRPRLLEAAPIRIKQQLAARAGAKPWRRCWGSVENCMASIEASWSPPSKLGVRLIDPMIHQLTTSTKMNYKSIGPREVISGKTKTPETQ